jgi:hypothetical protein
MATKSEQERARAEVRFAKAQKQASEAATVQAARDLQAKVAREKTARLRALRLAKEAAESAAAAPVVARTRRPAARKRTA